MKVYVTFWFDGEADNLDEVFTDESKAKGYIDTKNNTSRFGWHYEPVEVSE